MPQTPEDRAREQIEQQLLAAGWVVQDTKDLNLTAGRGIAVREFPFASGHGEADYLLYGDRKALGIIEAKKEGDTLTGVEVQTEKYGAGLPSALPAWQRPLSFLYQSTGVEKRFTNALDPDPRSHSVFTFHQPQTLIAWAQGVKANVLFFERKPASETPWTKTLWVYDFRTNKNFTLKTNPLKRADLDDFVACYRPENRHDRTPAWSPETLEGRWRSYPYEELLQRDKVSLDIFWLRDESLEDSASLPEPDVLATEIMDDLQTALEQFALIAADLDTNRLTSIP